MPPILDRRAIWLGLTAAAAMASAARAETAGAAFEGTWGRRGGRRHGAGDHRRRRDHRLLLGRRLPRRARRDARSRRPQPELRLRRRPRHADPGRRAQGRDRHHRGRQGHAADARAGLTAGRPLRSRSRRTDVSEAMTHHDHDHGHDHGHGHSHAGHAHAPASFGRAFAIGILLNTIYVVAEAGYGVYANSLALLADAGHNFGDVLGLGVAWLATLLTQRAPSERFTYGLRGTSILAALSNAVVLLLVTGGIAWEAILRLWQPEPSAGATVMAVAAIGVVINGVT